MPRWLLAAPILALCAAALAVPPDAAKVPADNADAEQAAKRAQVAGGLTATLWAAEPLLKNPVAFAFDEHGKCFVVETNRYSFGVPDTRGHMRWLDEDIAATTVADRLAMYKRHKYEGFEGHPDQLLVLWDSANKGKADRSEVFSGGYSRPEDGIAAGVLARKGDVYFANIPDLYRLRDTKGTNKADVKESLATGFGVRAQFIGHDLHGLIFGPDGKLYFSVGDRGFTVKTKEGKTLSNPDSGAVLRCDPDGANLEVVHVGLRNPQELAFDDFGNLFTYENNSDSGDRARWVQVVEGGDSGWRCGYQYGTLMHPPTVKEGNRGPWNAEGIWHLAGADGPPAYVVPPLAHFGDGPAGIAHYPGVGLDPSYKDHFFACDFRASPANSKIWSLAVKPKGASFEVVDRKEFVTGMVPTDCGFGPDGAFYWSDWAGSWGLSGKGRIFRVADPKALANPAVAEAKLLLAGGLAKKSVEELAKLLGHPHQQVRLEAQYELAGRKREEAVLTLRKVAAQRDNLLARLHAIQGLGMTVRNDVLAATVYGILKQFVEDDAPEVRAVSAVVIGRVAGQTGSRTESVFGTPAAASGVLAKMTSDADPRVQAAAAVAYGRVRRQAPPSDRFELPPETGAGQLAPLFHVLKANDNRDAYVRHAAVQGLITATRNGFEVYDAWAASKVWFDTPAVRLGVVLALRRDPSPKLAEFLADPDPAVATEAARAIYDQRAESALPKLAALAGSPKLSDPIGYRALAANFFLGKPEHAARVTAFAARDDAPDHLRVAAVKLLADWARPPRRDPITGLRLALPDRPADVVATAVAAAFPKLFDGSETLRTAAVQLAAKLALKNVGPRMAALVADPKQPADVRAESLYALEAVNASELRESLKTALAATESKLRAAAVVVAARSDPATAGTALPAVLARGDASPDEKQAAFAALGTMKESKEADATLAVWLDKLVAGDVPADLRLDLMEAAEARVTARRLRLHAPLEEKLKAIDAAARAAEATDPLSRSRDVLAGGDADKGKAIFLNNAAVYCQRCHKLAGQGGEVGPPLDGVGKQHPREYLLEAILTPSKAIAKGYESVILETADGRTVSGVLRSKDAAGYVVVQGDGKVVTVPKADVDAEKPDKSAMPDDLHKKLSKRELRDVVEFLASLKDEVKK